MLPARVGLLIAVAVSALSPIARAEPAGLEFNNRLVANFTHSLYLDGLLALATPELAVGSGAGPTIYYSAGSRGETTPDTVWRSSNAGATWTARPSPIEAGGVVGLGVDAGGTLYLSREHAQHPVPTWASSNGGDTWINKNEVGRARECPFEPPFTAAGAAGFVIHTRVCGAPAMGIPNFTLYGWISSNGGVTYATRIIAGSNVVAAGAPVLFGSTTIYVPYVNDSDEVRIAKSTDGGTTWSTFKVATLDASADTVRPVAAVDDAGNVYLAWTDSAPIGATVPLPVFGDLWIDDLPRAFVARSGDGGTSWTDPLQVSSAGTAASGVAIAAGAAGKVAVSYFASDTAEAWAQRSCLLAGLGIMSCHMGQRIDVAQSLDATSSNPTYTVDVVAPSSATDNPGDASNGNGSHHAAVKMDIDDSGTLYVAFATLGAVSPALRAADRSINLWLAVQTAGPKLR